MRFTLAVAAAVAVSLLLLTVAPRANASEAAQPLYERGMALYEAEDFEGATDAFTEVLKSGAEHPAVHYNLGNAHFKSGRLGLAIYHYRRAHSLAPRDEDIGANLEYARFLALDAIEDEEARTDLKVETWIDRFSPREVARVPAALWLLAGLAAIAWQLSPAGNVLWRRLASVTIVLWAVTMAVTIAVEVRAAGGGEAVVLAREIVVRNGPGQSFDTAFLLHEGAEVVVEGERGRWTEISLPGDLRGWIESDAIARL